jgi:lipid A 3-O-deacylase
VVLSGNASIGELHKTEVAVPARPAANGPKPSRFDMNTKSILVCALAGAIAPPALAQEYGRHVDRTEIRFGAAFDNTGPLTNFTWRDPVANFEIAFAAPDLGLPGQPRPYLGIDLSGARNAIHFAYGGLGWDMYLGDRLSVSGSLGLAVNSARDLKSGALTRALGTRMTFHIGAGIGYDLSRDVTVQLYWNHYSNAWLHRVNMGHDSIGIRFNFRM